MRKTKTSVKPFVAVFAALAVLVVLQNLVRETVIFLKVPDNAGVSVLETTGQSLICVFQDGRAAVWDWNNLPVQKGDFKAASDRAVVLDSEHLVAVSRTDKKMLTVYTLPSGQKQKEISVGWEDQEIWPRISSDKSVLGLIRKNPADAAGTIVYEFLTVDLEKELPGFPVSLNVQQSTEDFIDYAIDKNSNLYAVGSKEKIGRIAAVDIEKGSVLWDQTYEQTLEFCSVIVSPDNEYLLAGNRDGLLYKIDAHDGHILKKIQLLEKGETRPITNDFSVLNSAFSPNGYYIVATIHPKAYFLKTNSDEIIYTCTPADRLVSRIAFSPDNRSFATSDIRAGYPVKIWPMPEGKH